MYLTSETRLADLLKEYPWLLEKAKAIDPRFSALEGPVGRLLLKRATVADLCKRAGLTETEVLDWLREMIEGNE